MNHGIWNIENLVNTADSAKKGFNYHHPIVHFSQFALHRELTSKWMRNKHSTYISLTRITLSRVYKFIDFHLQIYLSYTSFDIFCLCDGKLHRWQHKRQQNSARLSGNAINLSVDQHKHTTHREYVNRLPPAAAIVSRLSEHFSTITNSPHTYISPWKSPEASNRAHFRVAHTFFFRIIKAKRRIILS